MIDWSVYTIEELRQFHSELKDLISQKARDEVILNEMTQLNEKYLNSAGRESGGSWIQPLGAHDAYPEGWVVAHNDSSWTSIVNANVWEPSVYGWVENVEPVDPALWSQPSGSENAYSKGDQVIFEEEVWESTLDANVWSPAAHPAGWTLA